MDMLIFQNEFYYYSLICWIGLSIITFILLLIFKPSTYGRHVKKTHLSINNRLGWFIMELPTVILMPYFFFRGSSEHNLVILFFLSLYMIHYLNRVFIFPFRLKTKGKKTPISIVFSAIIFNICNTYFIGYYFNQMSHLYDLKWFFSPYFIIGLLLFITVYLF